MILTNAQMGLLGASILAAPRQAIDPELFKRTLEEFIDFLDEQQAT